MQVKLFLKKLVVVLMIITVLLPSLFSGMVLADEDEDEVHLTVERAGNYVANFAINFYENWSNESTAKQRQTKEEKNANKPLVRTQYSEGVSSNVNPDSNIYQFSNTSWINFVFENALGLKESPITGSSINRDYYPQVNDENVSAEKLEKEKLKELLELLREGKRLPSEIMEVVKDEDEVDNIYTLLSEGKVLPGDILVATTDGGSSKEFLLYVGGTMVLYAAQPENENQGALRYEYLQYYLRDMKNKLKEQYKGENKDYEDIEIPVVYGIMGVYRIGGNFLESDDSVFTTINEKDANLIFNNKGYYNPDNKYVGIPQKIAYEGSTHGSIFKWIIKSLFEIIKLIINFILYAFRMVIVGWVNIIESIVQSQVLSVGGSAETKGSTIDNATGLRAIWMVNDRVTVEGLFYNKVPIVDANFFNFERAGKYDITGQKDNVVYVLRSNLAGFYTMVRNLSIAIMLFILLYLGIKMAISTVPEKQANAKKMLVDWLIAFILVFTVHIIMYMVLYANQTIVDICEDVSSKVGQEMTGAQEELTIYEAIRTKAYAFGATEGTIGVIFYVVMVYLLIRYLMIYFKRYITIYILAIMGSFMGLKHAIDKIQGKKTTSFISWIKEFTCIVLLQSVHAILYTACASVALSVAESSFAGIVFAFVILHTMVHADKIFMKIFGIDKASSLADVNKMENPWEAVLKITPMYNFSKKIVTKTGKVLIDDVGLFSKTRFALTGKVDVGNGLISRMKMVGTGKDNYKDAKKALMNEKYAKLGIRYREQERRYRKYIANNESTGIISTLRIKAMKARMESADFQAGRLMGNHVSADTNKAIVANVAKVKKLDKQRFTRAVGTPLGIARSALMMGVAMGQLVEDPKVALTTALSATKSIPKYKTKRTARGYGDEVSKTRQESYANSIKQTKTDYNNARNKYLEKLTAISSDNWYGNLDDLKDDDKKKVAQMFKEYEKRAKVQGDASKLQEVKELRKLWEDSESKKEVYRNRHYDFSKDEYMKKINDINDPDWYGNLDDLKNASKYEALKMFKEYEEKAKEENDDARLKDIKELKKLWKEYEVKKQAYENSENESVHVRDLHGYSRDFVNAELKDAKDTKKAKDAIEGLRKIVHEEAHLSDLMKELHDKTMELAAANEVSQADAETTMNRELNRTLSRSRATEVSAGAIKASIAQYLHMEGKSKVSAEDLDGIIDMIDRRTKSEEKHKPLLSDNISRIKEVVKIGADGMSRKDAAASIAMALADEKVRELRPVTIKIGDKETIKIGNKEIRIANIDQEIPRLEQEIKQADTEQERQDLQKMMEQAKTIKEIQKLHKNISTTYRKIGALNKVSSIKNKQQLVGREKVTKNSRKKAKGGK